MAKIIVEILSPQKRKRSLHAFDKDCVQIGRGYNNDLILQDSFVSEEHLNIKFTDNGEFLIEDLKSHNGTFIHPENKASRKKTSITEPTEIKSGTTISVGTLTLRIFNEQHPILKTKVFKDLKNAAFSIKRKTTTLYALLAFFLIYFYEVSAVNPNKENLIHEVIFMEVMVFIALIIWSGIWAFVGHLIKQKANFRIHLTATLLYYVSFIPIKNFCAYLGYLFLNPFLEAIPNMILLSSASIILLYNHISFSTRLSMKKRLIVSVAIPICICVLSVFSFVFFNKIFNPKPQHYARLKPPIIKPLKVQKIDTFIDSLSTAFKQAQEKKNKED